MIHEEHCSKGMELTGWTSTSSAGLSVQMICKRASVKFENCGSLTVLPSILKTPAKEVG